MLNLIFLNENRDSGLETIFIEMWNAYCKDIEVDYKTSPLYMDMEDLLHIYEKGNTWIYVIEKGTEIIGFFMIGINDNKHPMSDYYIGEYYIKPEFRRNGYGKTAISCFIKEHPGAYCLFIFKENLFAQNFWKQVFNDLKYVDESHLFSAAIAPDDSYFYFFSRRS